MHDHMNVKLYRESFFSSPDLLADLTKKKKTVVGPSAKQEGQATWHKESENELEWGDINPLNAELIPICYLLALLELTIFSTLVG